MFDLRYAIASAFALSLALIACDSSEDETTPVEETTRVEEPGVHYTGTHLLTSNRDRVAVCLDTFVPPGGSGGFTRPVNDVRRELFLSVEEVLYTLTGHPVWIEHDMSHPPPFVHEGCPTPPSLYRTDLGFTPGGPFDAVGWIVEEPSDYLVHLFVLPDSESERLGGEDGWRMTTEEDLCSGDVCVGVTDGIYLVETDVSDLDELDYYLPKALGLEAAW